MLCTLSFAVVLLGDSPQGVALLHRVHLRLLCGLLNLEITRVHLGDADGVPERQNDLLALLLGLSLPRDLHLVAIDVDVELVGVEAMTLYGLLEGFGSSGLRLTTKQLR